MTTDRANPWIMTASGRAFDLVEPTAEMVHWPDVAEHLAKTARFAGATAGVFYSVAQHSVHVARLVAPEWKPWALLHDAHEAWLGDDTTPKKQATARIVADHASVAAARWLADLHQELRATIGENSAAWARLFPVLERRRLAPPDHADAARRALEDMRARIDRAVWAAAGLEPPSDRCRAAVRAADLVALATERRDLMPEGLAREWDIPLPAPDRRRIRPLPWPGAQALFQAEFNLTFPKLAQARRAA